MKRFIPYLKSLAVVCCLALVGCASSGGVSESTIEGTRGPKVDSRTSLTLADYLKRIPGVTVSGSGNNISVVIRGTNSFMASSEPLFVVDGFRVGKSYRDVSGLIVNMDEVSSVRVLKGADASMYGVEGNNGVILIETKTAAREH